MHALLALRALVWTVLVTFSLSSIPHVDMVFGVVFHLFSSPAYAAEMESTPTTDTEAVPAEPAAAEPAKPAEQEKPEAKIPAKTPTIQTMTPGTDASSMGLALPTPDTMLFSGAGALSMPIEVPPGRAGIAPNLALTYNSFVSNGWIGVGWTLEMGSIQRSTKYGVNYGTTGTNANAFVAVINGSSSELVRRTDWDTTTYQGYEAKIEGLFSKYLYSSTNGWLVITKNGTTYSYGATSSSRQDFNSGNDVFKWCLDKVQDVNGNTMTVTYSKDTTYNEIYLAQIDYTSNVNNTNLTTTTHQVLFTRDDGSRGDAPTLYTTNHPVKTRYRLSTITVKENGSTVRSYQLAYTSSPNSASGRSLLSSFTKKGNDGSSLPSTLFAWQNNGTTAFAWTGFTETGCNIQAYVGSFSGDIDGNAKTDAMFVADNGTSLLVGAMISNGAGGFTWTGWTSTGLARGSLVSVFPGDANGDGKTDFIFVADNGTQLLVGAMISNGGGGFSGLNLNGATGLARGSYVSSFPGDVDGDGTTDVIFVANNGTQLLAGAMISNGSGFTGMSLYGTGSNIQAYVAAFPGDVTGDGKTDVVFVANNGTNLVVGAMISNGGGVFTWTGWTTTGCNIQAYVTSFPGDINGDAKTDVMFVADNGTNIIVGAMISTDDAGGFTWTGWTTAPLARGSLVAAFSGDINGDGKTDFMIVADNSTNIVVGAMLSDGSGVFTWTGWSAAGLAGGSYVSSSSSDPNGDGKTDFMIVGNNGTALVVGAMNSLYSLDLLLTTTNPLGGTSTFSYTPSSAWNNTLLPFVLQTVSQLQVTDGMGGGMTTSYAYQKGYFVYSDRDFRGFRQVTATAMNGSQVETTTETCFYQGPQPTGFQDATLCIREGDPVPDPKATLKGQTERQLVTSKEGHTRQVDNTYDAREVGGTACQTSSSACFLRLTDTYVTTTDVGYQAYQAHTGYEYDSTFNVTHEHKYAQTSVEDVHTWFEYTNLTTLWILSKPTKVTVKDSSDATILSRKWMTYDGNGNLTAEEVCRHSLPVGTACDSQNSTQNVVTGYTLCSDNTGNVCTITDPRLYPTTLTYDTTKTYVIGKTSCIDSASPCTALTTSTEYDTGLGKVTKTVPPHLQGVQGNPAFTCDYDAFGRISHEYSPDDTLRGGYTLYQYALPGTPGNSQYVRKQEHIVYSSTSTDHYTTTYLDGLGRTYKTQSTGATADILTATDYDALGRVLRKWSPYFSGSTPVFYTTYVYDGLSRVTTLTKPDSTTVTTQYQGLTKRVQNERGYWTADLYDTFGRLRKVTDAIGTQTDYSYYDATNQIYYISSLFSVAAASNVSGLTNTTYMTYDSTGKKTAMTDPDMGAWSYLYDKSGNLICQYDAKQQTIGFKYDGLNRVTYKNYYATGQGITCSSNLDNYTPTNTVTYYYDGTEVSPALTYGKGMLTKISDPSNSETKTDQVLELDIVQRITKSQKTVGTNSPAIISKTYDTAGRTITLTYFPGTSSERAYRYAYDVAGNLTSLHDNTFSRDIALYTNFTALGQYQTATYPKPNSISVVSYYGYDPATGRIATLLSRKEVQGSTPVIYQNLSYLFDARGNLHSKIDALANLTHTYVYDELDRLTSVTGSGAFSYSETYAYNEIGNIICKSDVGTYHYASGKPHAVSSTTDGPVSVTLTYDDNGNMTTRAVTGGDSLTIGYNADNKPVSITKNSVSNYVTYTYDGNGRRVRKVGPSTTTLYYGEAYEERTTGGSTVGIIHLFAGSRRVVSIRSDGYEQHYLTDHLGSASVVTDGNGDMQEKIEYFPYGTYRERSDYSSSFPDVNYTFTDQEEDDEVGLYNYGARLYDPLLGRFISPDSVVPDRGDLQALNRYSYCVNNPLIYTDPSGNWAIVDDLIAAGIGAIIGGVEAALTGGNILQGMAQGAVTGVLMYETGQYEIGQGWITVDAAGKETIQNLPAVVAAHTVSGAASGGIGGAISGGDIGQGMVTGAIAGGTGAFLGSYIPSADNQYADFGIGVASNAAIGGISGGITAQLYGGNFGQGFGQGAMIGALGYMLNKEGQVVARKFKGAWYWCKPDGSFGVGMDPEDSARAEQRSQDRAAAKAEVKRIKGEVAIVGTAGTVAVAFGGEYALGFYLANAPAVNKAIIDFSYAFGANLGRAPSSIGAFAGAVTKGIVRWMGQ